VTTTSRRGVCFCFLHVFVAGLLAQRDGRQGRERRRQDNDIARCHFLEARVVFDVPTTMISRRGVHLCFLHVFLFQDFLLNMKGQQGRERRQQDDDVARCNFLEARVVFDAPTPMPTILRRGVCLCFLHVFCCRSSCSMQRADEGERRR